MAASQDFQQAMRRGNIGEAIKTALSEVIELEITTWVVSAEDRGIDQSDPQNALPGYRMTTRINIVDGDIENEIGSQFIGQGSYRELREFHLNQVKQGQEIIRRNLEAIQELFSFLLDARGLGEGTGRSPASLLTSARPEGVKPMPTPDYPALAPTEAPPLLAIEPSPIEKEILAPVDRLWGDASDTGIPADPASGEYLEAAPSLIEPPAVASLLEPASAPMAKHPVAEKEIFSSVENLWGDRPLEAAAAPITVDQLPDGAASPEIPTTPIAVGSVPVELLAFGSGDEDITPAMARLWGDDLGSAIGPDAALTDVPADPLAVDSLPDSSTSSSDALPPDLPPASASTGSDLSFFDQSASSVSAMPDGMAGLEGAIGSDLSDLPDLTVMGDLDAALSAIPDSPATPASTTESGVIDFPADLFDETVEPEWEVFPPESVTAEFSTPATPTLDAFHAPLNPEASNSSNLGANLGTGLTPSALDPTPPSGITSDSLAALFGSDPPIGELDGVSTVADFTWSAATIPSEAVTATESSTTIPKEFLDADRPADNPDFPNDFGSGLSAEAEQALDNLFSPNQGLADELDELDELTDQPSNTLSHELGSALLDTSDSSDDGLNWDAIISDPLPNAPANPLATPAVSSEASLDADSLAALFAEPPADGNLDSNPFDQAGVAELSFEAEDSGELGSDPLDALFGEPAAASSSPSKLDLLTDLDGSSGDDGEAGESDPFANFPINLPTSGRGFGGGKPMPPTNPKKKADPNASEG